MLCTDCLTFEVSLIEEIFNECISEPNLRLLVREKYTMSVLLQSILSAWCHSANQLWGEKTQLHFRGSSVSTFWKLVALIASNLISLTELINWRANVFPDACFDPS